MGVMSSPYGESGSLRRVYGVSKVWAPAPTGEDQCGAVHGGAIDAWDGVVQVVKRAEARNSSFALESVPGERRRGGVAATDGSDGSETGP